MTLALNGSAAWTVEHAIDEGCPGGLVRIQCDETNVKGKTQGIAGFESLPEPLGVPHDAAGFATEFYVRLVRRMTPAVQKEIEALLKKVSP